MSRPSLRALPSVDRVAAALEAPHSLAVTAARRAVEAERADLRANGAVSDPAALLERTLQRARHELAALSRPSLRPVLNATGVILHTNLGRAPLPRSARLAVERIAGGYSNLELDAGTGRRGSRQVHVAAMLSELTGAEAALVVNNGAGAVLLAVAAAAGRNGAVLVSRGQAIEIGGGFRIPEVVAQAGARLLEVGTTNRTRPGDYRAALEAEPEAVILRVHPSNFRTLGFTESVEIEDLCGLGAPVVDDLGSGALAHDVAELAEEPDVRRSIRAGVAVACFSGDKLLGGPQAGILVGRAAAVQAAARHPLARALRIDKLSLAALEATLRLYRDPDQARSEIPALAMLTAEEATLEARARRMVERIGDRAALIRSAGRVGGGALPLLELEGPAVALSGDAESLSARLRDQDPPVIARIAGDRVVLDPRTLIGDEVDRAAEIAARLLRDPDG